MFSICPPPHQKSHWLHFTLSGHRINDYGGDIYVKGLLTIFANFFVDTSKDEVSMLLGIKAQKDHFKNGITCFIENLSASKIFQIRQGNDLI